MKTLYLLVNALMFMIKVMMLWFMFPDALQKSIHQAAQKSVLRQEELCTAFPQKSYGSSLSWQHLS